MVSQHYFTFPFQIPRVVAEISNWPQYLSNYLLRRRQPAEYRLRKGFRLIDSRGTLAGTIAVVFVRREYGPMEDYRTIVDIGANMGTFTVYAALKCPTAKIYCFEPEEQNFECLSQNIKLNQLEPRVKAFRSAVAGTTGARSLRVGLSPLNSLVRKVGHEGEQTVTCVTIGAFCREERIDKVDLLKMNCEGAEYEIFEGCSLEDFQLMPRIRLEYHHLDELNRNGPWLTKFLESKGYYIEHYTSYRGESGFIWAVRKSSQCWSSKNQSLIAGEAAAEGPRELARTRSKRWQ